MVLACSAGSTRAAGTQTGPGASFSAVGEVMLAPSYEKRASASPRVGSAMVTSSLTRLLQAQDSDQMACHAEPLLSLAKMTFASPQKICQSWRKKILSEVDRGMKLLLIADVERRESGHCCGCQLYRGLQLSL